MKVCYTVCSLNRLGQILVLSKTFLSYNQDYKFFACLVDEIDGRISVNEYPQIEFVPFSFLNFPNKNEISNQYDIFELSCAAKAFFGNFLLDKFQAEILIYLDTDICVYDSFSLIERQLMTASILITPHFERPFVEDGRFPLERDVLNSGIYNVGFFTLKNCDESTRFLHWWQARLFTQGYNNVCEGMMVDQLWLNLVPIYFPQSKVLFEPTCNLAYWNLPERSLEFKNGRYFVNDQLLIFFHFSGYRLDQPEKLSAHQNRVKESDNLVLQKIIKEYHQMLIENKFEKYLPLAPYYGRKKDKKKVSAIKKGMILILAQFGYSLEKIRKIK